MQIGDQLAAIVIVLLCLRAGRLHRALAAEASAPPHERATREIYVPFSDLHVLLEQQPKRVLLGREEYDDLVKKAKKSPETHAPRPAAIVAADYAVTAGQQRAEIQGTLTIDVLEDGLHALPLDIGGVGLQNAKLDDRSAAIGRGDAGRLVLFVEGIGRHELALEMVAPLETTAARQVLNFRLPRPAAAKLRLTAPGDVEIKGGADVVSRTVDEAAKLTRFELLPREGDTSLVMTLNSHLQRQQRAVVARSVLVDEVTQAYEKLHATVSLEILYRAVDQFRFVVPEGFEITEVSSPLLARWDVQQEGGRKVLGVRLREQTTETVVLRIAAIRTPGRLEDWHAPRLEPLDVVGSVTVFGLLVEDRLKAESLAAEGLIPIDTSVLERGAAGDPAGRRAGHAGLARRGGLVRPAERIRAGRPIRQAAGRNGRHHQPAAGRGRQGAGGAGRAVVAAAGGKAVLLRHFRARRLASRRRDRRRRPAAAVRALRASRAAHRPTPPDASASAVPARHARRRGVQGELPRRAHAAGLAGRVAIARRSSFPRSP